MNQDRRVVIDNQRIKPTQCKIKLFVGHIPSQIDGKALYTLLSKYTAILEVKIIYDQTSGYHQHCAFAFVESDESVSILMAALDGRFVFQGMRNPVSIDYAQYVDRRKGKQKMQASRNASKTDHRKGKHRNRAREGLSLYHDYLESYSGIQLDSPFLHLKSSPTTNRESSVSTNKSTITTMDDASINCQSSSSCNSNSGFTQYSNIFNMDRNVYSNEQNGSYLHNNNLTCYTAPSEVIYETQQHTSSNPIEWKKHLGASNVIIPLLSTNDTHYSYPYIPQTSLISPPMYYQQLSSHNQSTIVTSQPISQASLLQYQNCINVSPTSTMIMCSNGMYVPYIITDHAYSTPFIPNPPAQSIGIMTVSDVSGYHHEGPPGANIFVYHVPSSLTDQGLFNLFSPFGTILSTKVYVDRVTKESRGFGFISYSSISSAEDAISKMNGYVVNGKHLKVQKKNEKYQT